MFLCNMAVFCYREVTLKKCWKMWTVYVEWRKHRQEQYAVADAHNFMRVLPKCLSAWLDYVEIQQRKRELNDMAQEFQK